MGTTTNIEIDHSEGWKEIATSGGGFITASRSIEYCESAAAPVDTLVGHHLKTFDSFRYDLAGSKIYARGAATITVTED